MEAIWNKLSSEVRVWTLHGIHYAGYFLKLFTSCIVRFLAVVDGRLALPRISPVLTIFTFLTKINRNKINKRVSTGTNVVLLCTPSTQSPLRAHKIAQRV